MKKETSARKNFVFSHCGGPESSKDQRYKGFHSV